MFQRPIARSTRQCSCSIHSLLSQTLDARRSAWDFRFHIQTSQREPYLFRVLVRTARKNTKHFGRNGRPNVLASGWLPTTSLQMNALQTLSITRTGENGGRSSVQHLIEPRDEKRPAEPVLR